MAEEAKELSDIYTITIDGQEREIKATYGLLQKVCMRFNNFDQVIHLADDFTVLSDIANEFLAERDEKGRRLDPDRDYTINLDIEEGNKFNDWMVAHIIDFFISRSRALPQTNKQLQRLVDILEEQAKQVQTLAKESKQPSNG